MKRRITLERYLGKQARWVVWTQIACVVAGVAVFGLVFAGLAATVRHADAEEEGEPVEVVNVSGWWL